jgi:hypothetical protein
MHHNSRRPPVQTGSRRQNAHFKAIILSLRHTIKVIIEEKFRLWVWQV